MKNLQPEGDALVNFAALGLSDWMAKNQDQAGNLQ